MGSMTRRFRRAAQREADSRMGVGPQAEQATRTVLFQPPRMPAQPWRYAPCEGAVYTPLTISPAIVSRSGQRRIESRSKRVLHDWLTARLRHMDEVLSR
jgi:hypothetical protein